MVLHTSPTNALVPLAHRCCFEKFGIAVFVLLSCDGAMIFADEGWITG